MNVCARLWDVDCGACLRILEGHEELVRCIRFDGKRIVSGAYDGCVRLWSAESQFSHVSAVICCRPLGAGRIPAVWSLINSHFIPPLMYTIIK